jgi:hypothetical protein
MAISSEESAIIKNAPTKSACYDKRSQLLEKECRDIIDDLLAVFLYS